MQVFKAPKYMLGNSVRCLRKFVNKFPNIWHLQASKFACLDDPLRLTCGAAMPPNLPKSEHNPIAVPLISDGYNSAENR